MSRGQKKGNYILVSLGAILALSGAPAAEAAQYRFIGPTYIWATDGATEPASVIDNPCVRGRVVDINSILAADRASRIRRRGSSSVRLDGTTTPHVSGAEYDDATNPTFQSACRNAVESCVTNPAVSVSPSGYEISTDAAGPRSDNASSVKAGGLRTRQLCFSRNFSVSNFASSAALFASATLPSSAVRARFKNQSSPHTPIAISAFAKMVKPMRHALHSTNAFSISTASPTRIRRAILSAQSELKPDIDFKSWSLG